MLKQDSEAFIDARFEQYLITPSYLGDFRCHAR
jgi:hypothetical protein